ncbi:hypothetical protein [Mucilaginibacter psychrotolerans]|uniref:Uncharacterized protein n=1 Tax=Mucilaginibacter psychrotolerans TaxID=1524096 RepID=A0A4Y8S9J1_9SPHI|nr:hypothetical protein [Mucilaginibacter psychrotolerans]TFF35753.1 hypothetical protein E2R66_17685 [Mucilaginibacter psychrotolerans]
MKKAFLLALLLAGAGRLMAQNDLKLPGATALPLLSITVDTTLQSPTLKQLTQKPDAGMLRKLATLDKFNQTPLTETKLIRQMDEYLMPVAVLSGKSNMPIKKIGGFYTMPVYGTEAKKKLITVAP